MGALPIDAVKLSELLAVLGAAVAVVAFFYRAGRILGSLDRSVADLADSQTQIAALVADLSERQAETFATLSAQQAALNAAGDRFDQVDERLSRISDRVHYYGANGAGR